MTRAARIAFAAGPAAIVSFGLFLTIQRLVSEPAPPLDDRPPVAGIDLVRLRRDEARPEHRRVRPDRPPPPPPSAAPPPARVAPTPRSGPLSLEVEAPAFESPPLIGQPLAAGLAREAREDGDVVPLVRVEPSFPRRARMRNQEGWVLVEFTIGIAGTVEAATVVDADPAGLFDRAALDAIEQWRYRPRMVNGRAVPRPGVQVRMSFVLEDR